MKPVRKDTCRFILTILFLAACALVYVVTMRPGNSWNGDFNYYVQHTINIATGRPYAETGYIYLPSMAKLGPLEYPPGFPLLLLPVYLLFGVSLTAIKLEIILFLLLSIILLLSLFKDELPFEYRLGAVSLFAFSPYIFLTKEKLLSDVPFLFFMLLSILWVERCYRKNNLGPGATIICVLLFVWSYQVRTVGIVLLPSLLAYDVWRHRKPSRFAMLTVAGSFLGIFIAHFLVKPEQSYLDTLNFWSLEALIDNWRFYLKTYVNMWPAIGDITGSGAILSIVVFLLTILGFAVRLGRRVTIFDIFLPFYMAMVLAFPYKAGRYLLPLVPHMVLYSVTGARYVKRLMPHRAGGIAFIATLALVVSASYAGDFVERLKKRGVMYDGPYTPEATCVYSYIRDNIEPDAIFAARKPRILAYMTGRSAAIYPMDGDHDAVVRCFSEIGVTRVLLDTMMKEDRRHLEPVIIAYPSNFREEFRQGRFVVFSFVPPEGRSTIKHADRGETLKEMPRSYEEHGPDRSE